jgi:predicted enzyme related to lactoylglutathione lyase
MKAVLGHVNLFTPDPTRLSAFYSELFGFKENEDFRSPIFRGLDGGNGFRFGFNAPDAYDLLGLAERRPKGDAAVTTCYITFEVPDGETVAALAAKAVALGGRIVKAPYDTYYNAHQCVLADPEDNIFRLNYSRPSRIPPAS